MGMMPHWLFKMIAVAVWCLAAAPLAAERLAFVVGVGGYARAAPLPNALRDATLVAQALQARGFRVITLADPNRKAMLHALAELRLEAQAAEVVAVYFAGHGVQLGAETHLFLRDADPFGSAPLDGAVPLRVIERALSDKPRQKLILVDACRTGPFHGSDALTGMGAGPVSAPSRAGTHVIYASQSGAPAFDGAAGHSPFAAALAVALKEGVPDVASLERRVRLDVVRVTGGAQVPWSQSSLLRAISLSGPVFGG